MAAPPPYKRFSPLRFPSGKQMTGEDAKLIEDLIRRSIDEQVTYNWNTYATLPPGAAPGTPGGGGAGGPWNLVNVYAKPDGADSNDGLSWQTAKKYGYSAAEVMIARGGGTLNYADLTYWGGPVANQGPWFRGDGLNVPGFLPQTPMNMIGWQGGVYSQFSYSGAARMIGGGRTGQGRGLPALWSVRTFLPFYVTDFVPNVDTIANCPYRVGYDYRRAADGSIASAAITQWARSSGSATVTVSLPPGINITSATRVGTIVTLNFASTAPLPIPISRADAQWIKVTSSDSNFPSGDKQVFASNGVDYLQYVEAGPAVSAGAIGSWASHGICAYDRITVLTSVSAEVIATTYKVASVTNATTFTVPDPYGFAPRTANITVSNPGTYVLEDRFNYASGVTTLINCQGGSIANQSTDSFEAGPTFDFGGSEDARQVIQYAACTGGHALNATVNHMVDLDRAANFLFDGGAIGSPAIVMRDCRPAAGGIRAYPSRLFTSSFDFDRIIADINIVAPAPPVVEIINGTFAYFMYANQCFNTDNADPTVPNVKYDAGYYSKMHITDCGLVSAGPSGGVISGVWGSNGDWTGVTDAPFKTNMYGTGPGGKYTGTVASSYRSLGGIFSARFQNLIPDDSSTWLNGIGATVTAGQADPFGGTQAVKIDGTGLFRFISYITTGNAVGDYWVACAMVRKDGGIPPIQQDIFNVNQVADNGPWQLVSSVPYYGDGDWQFTYGIFKLANASTPNNNTICYGRVTTTLTWYRPTLFRIPASLGWSDDEVYEFLQTLRPQPAYLPPGLSGTDVGRKFVAHGGMCVPDAILDAPTGATAALQKWEPRANETGGSPRWAPLFDTPGSFLAAAKTLSWKWTQLSSTIDPNSGSVFVPADVGSDDTGRSRFAGVAGNAVGQTLAPYFATSNFPPMNQVGFTYAGGKLSCSLPWISATGTGTGTINVEVWYCTTPSASGTYTQVASKTISFNSTFTSDLGGTVAFSAPIPAGAFVFLAVYRSDNTGTLALSQVGLQATIEASQ